MAIDPFTIARLGIGAGQLAQGLSTMRERRNDRRGQERIQRLLAQAQGRNLRQAQAIAGSGVGVSPALAQRAALDSVNESNQAATQAAMDQESALALADRERADRLAGAELGAIGAFGGQLLTALQGAGEDEDEPGAGKDAAIEMARQIEAKRDRQAAADGLAYPDASQVFPSAAAAPAASGTPAAGGAAAGAVPPLDGLAALEAQMDQESANENLLSQFLGGQLSPEQMSALEEQYAPVEQPENMSIEGLGMTPGATPTDPLDAFSPGNSSGSLIGAVDAVGRVRSGRDYDARTEREGQGRARRTTDQAIANSRVADLSLAPPDMAFDLEEAEFVPDMEFGMAEAEADDMTFSEKEAFPQEPRPDMSFTIEQAEGMPDMTFGIEEAELGGRPDMAFDSREALGVGDPGLAYRANPFGVDTRNSLGTTQNADRYRTRQHRTADAVFNSMSLGAGDAPVIGREMLYESPELVTFFTPTGDRNNLDILAQGGAESQGAMAQLVNILSRTSSAHTAREHAQRILTRAIALRARQMDGM
jgi:hypothetical protein